MCTILILQRVHPDHPLVLATNRDEFYARPTSGPERILESPVTVGGRDLKAGGTWMGVTAGGLFVGVTNQRTATPPPQDKRSRGELVMNALEANDVGAIRAELSELDGREYNSFNLLFGTAQSGLFAAYGRVDRADIEVEPVPDGVHVLPNDRLDSAQFPKVERARELLLPAAEASWAQTRHALKVALADRQLAPPESLPPIPDHAPYPPSFFRELSALCVRTPVYGTRSSTVIALGPGSVAEYWYADGPPDETAFEDVTPLLG